MFISPAAYHCRSTGQRGASPDVEVVHRNLAHVRQLHVRMRVDAAWDDVPIGGVYDAINTVPRQAFADGTKSLNMFGDNDELVSPFRGSSTYFSVLLQIVYRHLIA